MNLFSLIQNDLKLLLKRFYQQLPIFILTTETVNFDALEVEMKNCSHLSLITILNQPHLAKKILNYIGNFEDINNLAHSSFEIYDTLKGKSFSLCLNIPDPNIHNNDWNGSSVSRYDETPPQIIPWIQKSLGFQVASSTITELEIPYIECMQHIAPIIATYEIKFPNLQKFSWHYSYFTLGHNESGIVLQNNLKMIEHVLKGIKDASKLKYFCFHFFQPYKNDKPGINDQFLEDVIVLFTKYLTKNLSKIEFGKFYTFTAYMKKDVSFENFDTLNYLYLSCFEENIKVSKNLKVLVVKCSNYEAENEFEEGDDIDVNEIEYSCKCREVGKNFSYSINHNVGISLSRLTIYFNNPIFYNFYCNNLPEKEEMYIPNFDYSIGSQKRQLYNGLHNAM